ncbi:hypothetical protein JYU34_010035 [Plutella xylostella]|uniref:Uncharacterized protein n=1 Tax=Plutella xylostella TaxID=51655 RepID=A0ABQ7QHM2_PLUXY|nr:hypothetical protein JYU34_010035 [Plutella xylostella]
MSATDPELHNVVRAARSALAVGGGATVGALAARYPAAPSVRLGARGASSVEAAGGRSGAHAAASLAAGVTHPARAATTEVGPVNPRRAMSVMISVSGG